MAAPQEAGRVDQHQIPRGFEKYFGTEQLPIVSSRNLLADLRCISYSDSEQAIEAARLANHLITLTYFEWETKGHTRIGVVVAKDTDGNVAPIVVGRDTRFPQKRNPAYKNIRVIGGCGLYDTQEVIDNLGLPLGTSPVDAALVHTKFLDAVMARKTWMAGLDIGGMKATIPGESDWNKSVWLQRATGYLFSPAGPFKDAITGTDAGQTPDTIKAMAEGSFIGGDNQIAGTIEALDTPASCRFSLDQTHRVSREKFGDQVPLWEESRVLVEAFGRIGRTAARLALEKGAKSIVIADPLLTDEDELLPEQLRNNPEKLKLLKAFVKAKLAGLIDQYGPSRVKVVKTTELEHEEGQIFIPCSTDEGNLTEEKLNNLHAAGVRAIFPGANGPLARIKVWELARHAASLGIIMPPEILTNCGSVTAASMEPLFRARLIEKGIDINDRKAVEAEATLFVNEVVVPHIQRNTEKKLTLLMDIKKAKGVDLYTAGEIAFRQFSGIPYSVTDGILSD